MLEVVGQHLTDEGIKWDIISGTVPVKERAGIVDDFNNNPRGIQVKLISVDICTKCRT